MQRQAAETYLVVVREERLIWALGYDGPHGFEKYSIVLAKLTNTVSSYPQEGTISVLRLNRPCCKQINRVSDKTRFIQF